MATTSSSQYEEIMNIYEVYSEYATILEFRCGKISHETLKLLVNNSEVLKWLSPLTIRDDLINTEICELLHLTLDIDEVLRLTVRNPSTGIEIMKTLMMSNNSDLRTEVIINHILRSKVFFWG